MKPVVRVLLDVDGVINAATRKPGDHWTDWQIAPVGGFEIVFSPTVIAAINELVQLETVEVLWLTTWGQYANKLLAPVVGLPELEVAGEPPDEEDIWWKFAIAKALWEGDQVPFVWIDDDLGDHDDGASDWIHELGGAAIGVRPAGDKGLTQKLIDVIWDFVTDAHVGARA